METDRPQLSALASYAGILPAYEDVEGTIRHTSPDTYVRLLAAMGFDGSTEAAAASALMRIQETDAQRLLDPVRVVAGKSPRRLLVKPLSERATNWELEIVEETGAVYRWEGTGRPGRSGNLTIPLPSTLPAGYHDLRLTLQCGRQERSAEQLLIVTPGHCPRAREHLGERQALGLLTNLYTLRSNKNWGVGDLSDLGRLVDWSAKVGASFIGLSPLHALRNEGFSISPYSPVSRLFRNVLYLDVAAIPELAHAPAVRRRISSLALQNKIAELRCAESIDYSQVLAFKQAIMKELFRVFVVRHGKNDTVRGRAYRRYVKEQGQALQDFTTFVALQEDLGRTAGLGHDWRGWPARYRNPQSEAVRKFRASHRREIEFQCYLQFELDRQLEKVQTRALKRDLRLGLYQDLAVGSSPSGSDTWAFPGLFVENVSVGAPPDPYAAEGQNWGLPPVHPGRLAENGYEYWIRLVRAALAHAGALRLDHVMGLFRQFWVPEGCPGSEGAYVRYPSESLLAILALESTRAGALVIGEDLGTVPRGLPRILERWGILSTRVLYFERNKQGSYRSAGQYRRHALVSANTHDLAPLAGFWAGRDLELRRQAGIIASEQELAEARQERARDRRLLLRRLKADGLLKQDGAHVSERTVRKAVHLFLRRTPSVLVSFSLDDVAGETEPVNLPGVTQERYPSWSRRMSVSLEDVERYTDAKTLVLKTAP